MSLSLTYIDISGAAEEGGCHGCSRPNVLLSKNVLKEILFTLQFLTEELNSIHSSKPHRFGLL